MRPGWNQAGSAALRVVRLEDGRSVLELGLHGRCGVDANQPGLARAEVGEAVRDVRWPDDDVAWPAFDGLVTHLDQDAALQDDERLVVGMVVQLRCWLC